MRYLPDGEQMKAADSYTIHTVGVPSLVLMERAAKACVQEIKNWGLDLTDICVVCGSGNNGGDGFAIARMFAEENHKVTAVLVGNPDHCTEETAYQIEEYRKTVGTFTTEFAENSYSLVIDAIFGVGLCREIRGKYAEIIHRLNAMECQVMAVDIPSGISSATGQILGVAVKADYTVSIQETKLGVLLDPGRSYTGELVTADIGIHKDPLEQDPSTAYTLDSEDYRKLLPVRREDSNKGSYGRLLLISGSKGMSGAAYLNALSSYRTGAGLVQIYTAEENRIILQSQLPEAILTTYEKFDEEELIRLLKWADVVAIGSGIGQGEVAKHLVTRTLTYVKETKIPCVIDADGLNLLSENMECLEASENTSVVLTPHMKEFERLSGVPVSQIKENRMEILNTFVERYHLTCVLKDARTIIMSSEKRPYVNLSGCQAMAKAGSGDVLAGIIASLLGQHMDTHDAAVLGVYIHGKAGELMREKLGNYGILARELADGAGISIKKLEELM